MVFGDRGVLGPTVQTYKGDPFCLHSQSSIASHSISSHLHFFALLHLFSPQHRSLLKPCLLVLLVLVSPLPRPKRRRLLLSRWRRLPQRPRRRPRLTHRRPPQRMSPLYYYRLSRSAFASSGKGGRGRSSAKKPLTYVSVSLHNECPSHWSRPEEVPSDIDQEDEVEVVQAPPCVTSLHFSSPF